MPASRVRPRGFTAIRAARLTASFGLIALVLIGLPDANAQAPTPPVNHFTPQEISTGSCWIDAKTGQSVPTFPPGYRPGLDDPSHSSIPGDPSTGRTTRNFVRLPEGSWIDSSTGQSVPTFPPGYKPGLDDPNHSSIPGDPSTGRATRNFVRVPCPPPAQSTAAAGGGVKSHSPLELGVLDEINHARTDPAHYRLDSCGYPGAAVEVGRSFVRMAMPIAPLRWDDRLSAVAGLQAADQGPKGQASHTGSDGSTPMKRMQKAGVWSMEEDEVISVGQKGAGCVVGQLVIDPPDTLHLHRGVLFDPMMQSAGVACGPNARFGEMCVIDLAGPPVPRD